jgi:hypothetical protein
MIVTVVPTRRILWNGKVKRQSRQIAWDFVWISDLPLNGPFFVRSDVVTVDQSRMSFTTLLHGAGWRWRMCFRGNDAPWHPSHLILQVPCEYWLVLPPESLPVKMKHVNMPSENLAVSYFLFSSNVRIVYVLALSVWMYTLGWPEIRHKIKVQLT